MKFPFENPYLLAPLLEPNDIAFRMLCKECGAGMTYTGMINPLTRKKIDLDDKPILQLFCNETKGIKEFIEKYDSKVSGWDFNLGCPSVVAKKIKIGSYLHDQPEKIDEILKEIRQNTNKFFSIKLRKSDKVFEIVKIAEKYCDAIAIHARTKEQGYSGQADLDFTLELKKTTKLPIIYSGDVSEKSIPEILKHFDYVMLARAAIGNPSIFSILTNSNVKVDFQDYLVLAEKYKIPFKQIKYQAFTFTKGMKNASELRKSLMKAKSLEEFKEIFNK